jgi:RNA polymerase sigma-70 factor, ECF subfamily
VTSFALPMTAMPGGAAAVRLPGVRLRRRGGSDAPEARAAEPHSPSHPQPTATFDAHEPHEAEAAGSDAAAAPADAAWTPPTWEQVVQEHSARVYRLAYRLTGNRHDAEDLTQEVFVRVFRSLSSYTPGTFEGWLHRITTNLFLDQVRRKQRIRFDALPEDADDRLAGSDPGPERAWEHNNLDHDVQAALDTLPPEFRAAVVLCDIEGLSYEEIAATLDVKLGTVRSRIHRGRAALRQALAHRRPEITGVLADRDGDRIVAGGESGL